jgi:hypothetical protein
MQNSRFTFERVLTMLCNRSAGFSRLVRATIFWKLQHIMFRKVDLFPFSVNKEASTFRIP